RRATDTTPPTITVPSDIIAYRGEEFEFYFEITDDSGQVKNIELSTFGKPLGLNWLEYSEDNFNVPGNATSDNPLRVRVHGTVPLNEPIPADKNRAQFTRTIRAWDAAGNVSSNITFVIKYRAQTDKYNPADPTITYVDRLSSLSPSEKNAVEAAVRAANPQIPAAARITVSANGTVTITYPDSSTDTITANRVVKDLASSR
nr:Chain A, Platelet-binding glycoprotein [Streptococcus sanguinis SK36]5EQ2_B Chain B, Platelet-binding glycoprotein [Streptococcus sanguinis SK36]5EQ3_A Chain A, Platelet-binding glycoprotein [Streptococcus sanguinis SK36]5EQ3_B Chain B, Platelet-binding glycoprotein [Streptococcus sanguinis SK36]5IJ1_A Chain A, Platelet-binding glycoprotein [Streptococcus sanguinis SK36]5IJ1_B Chain B, Platelet-binding glycoprotein [Streptococcus sanguinis SK36]5IJ2_A Chain A, Platelet-binding glycoprotein